MKKKQWILARNGEYIGRHETRAQVLAARETEQKRLEKFHQQGWFESMDGFRLDVFQR